MLSREHFVALLEALNKHGVRFVLIGGVAMRLHGSQLDTTDIYALYARDEENIHSLAAAFAPLSPRLRGATADLPFVFDPRAIRNGLNFTLEMDVGDVDLLGDVGVDSSFDAVFARSARMEVFGIPVHVASLEDLIAMKRAANRPKDQNALMELLALKKLIDEGSR